MLHNLNFTSGMCNGTQLIVKSFSAHVIDTQITSGSHIGDRVFILCMSLIPSDSGLPFSLSWQQFPGKLCFAMTINKSQSQTMDFVGLHLPQHVFTHGQLYVAMSRVGSADRIKVFVGAGQPPGRVGVYTRNVVYDEVLDWSRMLLSGGQCTFCLSEAHPHKRWVFQFTLHCNERLS